ncbi:RNA helicase [Marasmius crinis-equi]|uniref:RNA helicase n=1 Tax=Marasmius crinis-equi TaxID=585013 RepID=A0ABR3FLK7_9AGAR
MFRFFHSSASPSSSGARSGGSGRRRSGKSSKLSDLKPSEFVREEVPHSGLEPPEASGKSSSFRRLSDQANERDWMKRKGRWGEDLKNVDWLKQTKEKEAAQVRRRIAARAEKKYDSTQEANGTESGLDSENGDDDAFPMDTFLRPELLSDPTTSSLETDTDSNQENNNHYNNFTSPPLMPGLRSCLLGLLGPEATPTRIQALSLNHVLTPYNTSEQLPSDPKSQWKQWLLASETGSGKSAAYLLPVLQSLKLSELTSSAPSIPPKGKELSPRALILAPTHELSRQLSTFAKALQHEIKLRVMCASRSNAPSSGLERSPARDRGMTASEMSNMDLTGSDDGEFELSRKYHPVDVMVGTPMKLIEMVRGRGWEKAEDGPGAASHPVEGEEELKKLRRGRDRIAGTSKHRRRAGEMDLSNVEWVVVDEADVLFDPDFQETTRILLSDIAAARVNLASSVSSSEPPITNKPVPSKDASGSAPSSPTPSYPFNLLLTSATIPTSLDKYLTEHHPDMQRLVSPGVHKLPKHLKVEFANWTGGNRMADVEKRIRQVWADDALGLPKEGASSGLSQVLIFCNKTHRVRLLGQYLDSKGIKNVAVTSTSETRARGSNRHLDGFLRPLPGKELDIQRGGKKQVVWDNEPVEDDMLSDSKQSPIRSLQPITASLSPSPPSSPKTVPHVLITTSLLSRGLDFTPSIKHVFIMDEPRNVLDFLHRAGRSGRAGHKGKVVVFGKFPETGRGAGRGREVKQRVGELIKRRRR